jgi:hypothetical protein
MHSRTLAAIESVGRDVQLLRPDVDLAAFCTTTGEA